MTYHNAHDQQISADYEAQCEAAAAEDLEAAAAAAGRLVPIDDGRPYPYARRLARVAPGLYPNHAAPIAEIRRLESDIDDIRASAGRYGSYCEATQRQIVLVTAEIARLEAAARATFQSLV